MYKLVVLDIDGTLLTSDKKITQKTIDTIKKASELGVKFIIASGRAPSGVMPVADNINLKDIGGYILSFNGGCCLNYKTGEYLYENFIPNKYLKDIYDFATRNNIPMLTYHKDTMYTPNDTTKYLELEANINNLKTKKTSNLLEEFTHDFPKVILTDEGHILEKFVEKAQDTLSDLEVFRSEPFFLEICPQGIHKATGIAKVIDILGIKQEEVMAIGDGFNDLTMIEYAGLGVAMANAQDKVKEASDFITLSNDEDGVSHVIEKFILNK